MDSPKKSYKCVLINLQETRYSGTSIYEPLYNEVLGITNDILQPGQSYSEIYGTGPRYNEPRCNEILIITSTVQKPKRKMYLDLTNKCKHVTEKMNAKQTKRDEAS